MEKATIIYGPSGSGKTNLAQSLAQMRGNYLYFSASDIPEDISISDISAKTIIIDDCPAGFDFEYYFNPITQASGIKFIFVIEDKSEIRGASFEARFNLLDARAVWDDLPF